MSRGIATFKNKLLPARAHISELSWELSLNLPGVDAHSHYTITKAVERLFGILWATGIGVLATLLVCTQRRTLLLPLTQCDAHTRGECSIGSGRASGAA